MNHIVIRPARPEDVRPAFALALRVYMIYSAPHRRTGHLSRLYVDPAYHRRGIATALMDTLIAAMDTPKIALGSSPHGVPFYLKYGFVPTDEEQHKHGAIWTPMEYTPSPPN